MAKKALFFLILVVVAGAVFAQSKTSDIYPKTMAINRIYPHELGYRVDYIKANRTIGTFYAPNEWFAKSAGYGEIIYGEGKAYPYMTVYYEGGQISHFKLYVYEDFNNITWGSLRGDDYSEEFDVQELIMEYK